MTKGEKREIDDMGDSGGILLKSNTEAPGEEVVRSTTQPPLSARPLCFIASVPHGYTSSSFVFCIFQRRPAAFPFCAQDASLITVPTVVDPVTKGSVKGQMAGTGWPGTTLGVQKQVDDSYYDSKMVTTDVQDYYSGRYDSQYGQQLLTSGVDIDSRYLAQSAGFLHNWQTNGRYLQQVMSSRSRGSCYMV